MALFDKSMTGRLDLTTSTVNDGRYPRVKNGGPERESPMFL